MLLDYWDCYRIRNKGSSSIDSIRLIQTKLGLMIKIRIIFGYNFPTLCSHDGQNFYLEGEGCSNFVYTIPNYINAGEYLEFVHYNKDIMQVSLLKINCLHPEVKDESLVY